MISQSFFPILESIRSNMREWLRTVGIGHDVRWRTHAYNVVGFGFLGETRRADKMANGPRLQLHV